MPIIFSHEHEGKRYVVRSCSNRITVIDVKNHKVLREIDFKDHDTALFFADKFSHSLSNGVVIPTWEAMLREAAKI